MITRGKDSQNPGKFEFCIYNERNELVRREDGFDTPYEADRASEIAHRLHLFGGMKPTMTLDECLDGIDMTDEELLAELGVA